jgi:hypothetical protein
MMVKKKDEEEKEKKSSEAIVIKNNSSISPVEIDLDKARKGLAAIKNFQALVHAELKEGYDFGVIPGTDRPTLLKPGAEKIAKLLGCADRYEVMEKVEDWEKGFFHYQVKCLLISLTTDQVVSEGLGSCNSKESQHRWNYKFENELTKEQLAIKNQFEIVTRRSRKTGKTYSKYKIPNDEIFTIVNTLLKKAKKRALVDAALSIGRLSNLFTQDMEEIKEDVMNEENEKEPIPEIGQKEVQEKQEEPKSQPEPVRKESPPIKGKPIVKKVNNAIQSQLPVKPVPKQEPPVESKNEPNQGIIEGDAEKVDSIIMDLLTVLSEEHGKNKINMIKEICARVKRIFEQDVPSFPDGLSNEARAWVLELLSRSVEAEKAKKETL